MTTEPVYLFLDFDGVLHPFGHPLGFFSHMPIFEAAIRHLNVYIVISSAWRLHHTMAVLKKLFSNDIAQKIVGITPDLDNRKNEYVRELEIQRWLIKNKIPAAKWIALDDSPQLFSPNCPNLIVTDAHLAFNEDIRKQLLSRLSQ